MPSFDLVDDGWIPVMETATGEAREVGLRESLTRAHELSVGFGAADRLPLLRVLLAALDAACGPRDDAEWDTAWAAPTLDTDRINAYLEQWAHHLDLFHPEHPAFQCGALTAPNRDVKALRPSSLSGATGEWFDHSLQQVQLPPVDPATAVRQLLFLMAYDVAGIKGAWPGDPAQKGGKVYGGKTGPAAVTHVHLTPGPGRLKDVLLLNLPPQPRTPGDTPVWERPTPPAPIRTREADGRQDLWTWPLRRIRLHPDEHGQVTGLTLYDGDRLKGGAWGESHALDPMTAWNLGIKRPYPMPFLDVNGSPRPWRAAILLAAPDTKSGSATSRVIQHAVAACERGTIDPGTEITAVMAGPVYTAKHQSVIRDMPVGTMPIGQAGLLADPDTRNATATHARYAEDIERNLLHRAAKHTGKHPDELASLMTLSDLHLDWEETLEIALDNHDRAGVVWQFAIERVADGKINRLPGGAVAREWVRAGYKSPPPRSSPSDGV